METLQFTLPAAGWYRDPYDPSRLRWWDGRKWTAYVAPLPTQRPVRRRSPFTRAVATLLVLGLTAALILSLFSWSGGTLDIPRPDLGGEPLGQFPPPGSAPQQPPETSVPATDLSDAYAASVTVEASCGAGCVGIGGGVAVGPDTVLTAAHVVEESRVVGVRDADGTARGAAVIATDTSRDLALLHVDPHGLPYVSVRNAEAVIGEEAHVVGSPGGTRRISHGIVTDVLDLERDGVTEVQTNADIDQGNSGGPLLDANGQLLGIVVAEHERDDSIGWATSGADVAQFLAAAPSPSSSAPAPSADVQGQYRDLLEDLLGGWLD